MNYPPLADGNDLVRKRGRPRLSAPIPVLSLTRQDLPNPIVRKKKGDHKNRKIRFSNSYVTEYYCNFFDFTVISENKFTGAVIDTINTLIKESHPLVSHKKDFEDIKQIEALLRSTDCVSLTESQYDSKSFSAQQSNKKNPVCEVEQRALYSTTSLFPGDIISEISGLLCSSNDLDISDRRHTYCPISVSKIDGCDSSHLLPPFVFHVLSTDHTVASSLFLDCRDISSSDGRFVQFACRKDIACANAILRAVVVIPDSENEVSNAPDLNAQFGISTMGVMRFKVCIFALKSIKAGDEIIIEGNERYMNYPCPIIRSHDCRLDRAVSILENYEHSHIGGIMF